MKKLFILNGSRRKKGNTAKFINHITSKLENFEIETIHPQDFMINPCRGCNCSFIRPGCSIKDDLYKLEEKILTSDILILASPVYFHYMTGELKMILDRLSWWAHTFRLQGKPVVVLSTCSTNGHNKVIEPLSECVTFMGGNVIATANAALMPNQIENSEWLDEVSSQIADRIEQYALLSPQSNPFIEKVFKSLQPLMKESASNVKEHGIKNGEVQIWEKTGMLDFESFAAYLLAKHISLTGEKDV